MSDEEPSPEKTSTGRMFLPSLIVSFFAVAGSGAITLLFAVDIAREFQVPVGVSAQISTVANVVEFVMALLLGALAARFKHKSLFLAGVLLVAVSAVGNFLAPNFGFLLFFYAMETIGTGMVAIMVFTLIGDLLPLKKKAHSVSYILVVPLLGTIALVPLIGLIGDVAGWRSVFVLFILPVSVASLALAFIHIPSRSNEKPPAVGKKIYLSGFKQVLLNKSAASCLAGGTLISMVAISLFSITFFREQFSMSRDYAAVILIIAASTAFAATIVAGRLINKLGRKTLTVAGSLGSSILVMLVFSMPNLWLAIAVDMAHVWFAAIAGTAFVTYALEQVSESRGTMMSMRGLLGSIGGAIGAAVGGALLLWFSYQALGLVFGAIGITASAVFYFLTKDPQKT